MSEYLYNAVVYTNVANVIGLDIVQNLADLTDFNNYKANCVNVTEINIASTTFVIEKTYTQFKTLITGDYTWGDVKLVTYPNKYELFLLTNYPL